MGEARRKILAGQNAHANGSNSQTGYLLKPKRIRMVRSIRLQNVDADRATVLMLGSEREMELGVFLTPTEARNLAKALEQHADALDHGHPRIILPGGDLHA